MDDVFHVVIDGEEKFRGNKEECYGEVNKIIDSWKDDLPDSASILVERVKQD